jgi:hypothetical protein
MHDYYALSFKTVVFKDSCKTLCCRFLSLHLLTYALIESNVESVNGLEGTHGAAPSSFGAVSTAHIHA